MKYMRLLRLKTGYTVRIVVGKGGHKAWHENAPLRREYAEREKFIEKVWK